MESNRTVALVQPTSTSAAQPSSCANGDGQQKTCSVDNDITVSIDRKPISCQPPPNFKEVTGPGMATNSDSPSAPTNLSNPSKLPNGKVISRKESKPLTSWSSWMKSPIFNEGSSQRMKGCWSSLLDKWWYWEITCAGFGVMILLSSVTLLACINGMALEDWSFYFQPTTLLAVCMTVSKSAFMVPIAECISQSKWLRFARYPLPLSLFQKYDEASRGPMGALSLIKRARKIGPVALGGATLTLLALGTDAVAQQVVQYEVRQVIVPESSATLSLTQDLDHLNSTIMQGSILDGIYLGDPLSNTYTCTTGNCEWPASLITLGVCDRCTDITTQVSPVCLEGPGPLAPTAEDNDNWSFRSINCSYPINANITLSTYIQEISFPTSGGRPAEFASQWTQYKVISPPIEAGLGESIGGEERWIATMLSYATTYDKDTMPLPRITVEMLQPSLRACGLFWCAQLHESPTVVNGIAPDAMPATTFRLVAPTDEDGDETVQTSTGASNVLQVHGSDLIGFPVGASPNFTVDQASHLILTEYLENLFNITESVGNEAFSVFPETQHSLSGITNAIYATSADPSAAFARIARSMTEQVRQSTSSYVVAGNVLDNKTYISVEWAWMAMPLGVFVLACVLLAASILGSRRSAGHGQHRIWKSSSLAVLLQDLEGFGHTHTSLANIKKINHFAESTMVKLNMSGEHRGFTKCPSL